MRMGDENRASTSRPAERDPEPCVTRRGVDDVKVLCRTGEKACDVKRKGEHSVYAAAGIRSEGIVKRKEPYIASTRAQGSGELHCRTGDSCIRVKRVMHDEEDAGAHRFVATVSEWAPNHRVNQRAPSRNRMRRGFRPGRYR